MSKLHTPTLGDAISISKGKKHNVADELSPISKRIIAIDDLRNDENLRYTNDKKGTEVNHEDVIIAWDGANAGTIGFGKSGFIGSTIARLRIQDKRSLNTSFLGLYLQSKFDYLRKTSTGATIPHISRRALENIPLPKIGLSDQIRIAHLLGKVEALINQRKQHLQQLDELLKSVFLEMFGDPVRNEKGLNRTTLEPFITHITSGGRGWAKYYSETGKRFIRSLDVQMNSIGSDDVVYVIPPDNKESERTRVHPGDILLTITGSKIGRVCFVPESFEEAYISQHVAIIRTSKIDPIFLSYYMSLDNCGQREIKKKQYGQAKPGLNLTQISNFEILEPSEELQRKFRACFIKVDGVRKQYKEGLNHLENLYSILGQKAFKGELDLSAVPLPELSGPQDYNEDLEATTNESQAASDLSKLDEYPMDSAEGRKSLLQQWLIEFLTDTSQLEQPNTQYSLEQFWGNAQFKSVDYTGSESLDEDDQTNGFTSEDYDRLKDWLFTQVRNGRLLQEYNEGSNTVHLKMANQ